MREEVQHRRVRCRNVLEHDEAPPAPAELLSQHPPLPVPHHPRRGPQQLRGRAAAGVVRHVEPADRLGLREGGCGERGAERRFAAAAGAVHEHRRGRAAPRPMRRPSYSAARAAGRRRLV